MRDIILQDNGLWARVFGRLGIVHVWRMIQTVSMVDQGCKLVEILVELL